MGGFVKAIGGLFGGGGDGGASAAAAQQEQQAAVAQLRTSNATADAGTATNAALASAGRVARGQRLLVSSKDGGLASNLGGST